MSSIAKSEAQNPELRMVTSHEYLREKVAGTRPAILEMLQSFAVPQRLVKPSSFPLPRARCFGKKPIQ